MSTASDARFWDRTSRKYAGSKIADQAGYDRTLDRTRALLGPGDQVLELGCGTGTTAFLLAGDVQSYLAGDVNDPAAGGHCITGVNQGRLRAASCAKRSRKPGHPPSTSLRIDAPASAPIVSNL